MCLYFLVLLMFPKSTESSLEESVWLVDGHVRGLQTAKNGQQQHSNHELTFSIGQYFKMSSATRSNISKKNVLKESNAIEYFNHNDTRCEVERYKTQ